MLAEIVSKFPNCRILVIGDLIADEFVFGEIARVSREAPVMILRYERTETMPGGAGNAAANVAALADRADLIGAIGRDFSGRQLMLTFRAQGVNTTGILTVKGHQTPTKTRILAGSVHSTRQQVIRIDREPTLPLTICQDLIQRLRTMIQQSDAIIISDYNYGVINKELLDALRLLIAERPIPVIVDSRFRLRDCTNFTAATPNQAELEELANQRIYSETDLFKTGELLRQELNLQTLLLTRGSDGMVIFEAGQPPVVLAAVGSKDPVDVTGAGDTVIAAFSLALAAGANARQAAQIANHAGGLVVMKRGTATISRAELLASLIKESPQ